MYSDPQRGRVQTRWTICPCLCVNQSSAGRAGLSGATSEPADRLGWSWQSWRYAPVQIARLTCTTVDEEKKKKNSPQFTTNTPGTCLSEPRQQLCPAYHSDSLQVHFCSSKLFPVVMLVAFPFGHPAVFSRQLKDVLHQRTATHLVHWNLKSNQDTTKPEILSQFLCLHPPQT